MGHEEERAHDTGATKTAETLSPLADRVLVRAEEEEEVTAGGIIIPDAVRERPQRGYVVAVGPGSRTISGEVIPVGCAVGDTVVFSRYGGTEVKLEGEELVLLREQDVLGVIS